MLFKKCLVSCVRIKLSLPKPQIKLKIIKTWTAKNTHTPKTHAHLKKHNINDSSEISNQIPRYGHHNNRNDVYHSHMKKMLKKREFLKMVCVCVF
jgi:hypothetical protein